MASIVKWDDSIKLEQPWLDSASFGNFIIELSEDDTTKNVTCCVWSKSQLIRLANCVANSAIITHLHVNGKIGDGIVTSYECMKDLYYILKKHRSLEVLDLESLDFPLNDGIAMIPARLMFHTPIHTVTLPPTTSLPPAHILQEIEEIKKRKAYFYIGRWDIRWNILLSF